MLQVLIQSIYQSSVSKFELLGLKPGGTKMRSAIPKIAIPGICDPKSTEMRSQKYQNAIQKVLKYNTKSTRM